MSLRLHFFAGIVVTLASGAAGGATALHAQQEAEGLPTLAVLDLRDGGSIGPDAQDLSNLGTGIAMMLTTEMMRNPRVDMVERDRIRELVAEQKLSLSGMVDESTAIEVGKLVGARYMLFGSYTDVMSRLRIDVRVVNVETGRLEKAQEVTRPREELFSMVADLAGQIFDELELEPPERLPARSSVPATAVVHFSKAVAWEDRGEKQKAAEEYRKALELHPDYEQARTRLRKLEGGGT